MPTTDILTAGFDVALNGAALTPAQVDALRQATVEKSWSAADRLELEFDGYSEHVPKAPVGAKITVQLRSGGSGRQQSKLVFSGEVVGHSVRWSAGNHLVSVEAYDRRHRLTRRIEPTTHENVKLGGVVAAIAKLHGFKAKVPNELSTTKFEHLIVADTHFAVLQHIAGRTGSVWAIDDEDVITFAMLDANPGAPVEIPHLDLIDFDLRYTPVERPTSVEVHGWDQAQGKAISANRQGSDLQRPPTELGVKKSLESKNAVVWRGGAINQKDAEEIAGAIAKRMRSSEITARGTMAANPAVAPGTAISINGVSPSVNGTYVVESVVHRMGRSFQSAVTEFRIGSTEDSLAELVGGYDGRLGSAPPGVTIGIVTATKDPSNQGRVRLKLPLLSDQLQTGWVRLASIGSGPGRGIMFVPEVNDEVLVAFEHGDLNRPYVIGTVWNNAGSSFANLTKENKTEERRLVSKLGNSIRFVDVGASDATSGISIEMDGAKTRIFLGYEQVTIETKDRPLEIKNGRASIKLDKDEITISAQKLKIETKSDVDVSAQANFKVKANANVGIEATGQLEAKANAGVTIQSAAMTQLKGSMVKVN